MPRTDISTAFSERDAGQRQKTHFRRERLEAAGWRVIVITSADMSNPIGIVRRVHAALIAGGYDGADPAFSTTWRGWFAANSHRDWRQRQSLSTGA